MDGATNPLRRTPEGHEIVDKRPNGAFFVYLAPGWRLEDAHCFGEDTLADVHKTLKRVQPCACCECMRSLSDAAGGA